MIAGYEAHVNRGLARLGRMLGGHVETRAAGTKIYDENDQAYLDCGGYGVFILGHCHPRVVEAATAQIARHPLSSRLLLTAELPAAEEALARVAPDGLEYVFFTGSGTEATEAALKLARLNGRRALVSMHGGFHGKTLGALSVTGRQLFQAPFAPLLPDVVQVPYADISALETVLACRPGECCVILEPVQAEGGVVVPPPDYLGQVRSLCDAHGALLVLDEIQTGLGRLGAWWGAQLAGVVPDMLLVGKGLSGGVVPVSAVVATPDAFAGFNADPFLHTSTFAGSPIATATARAAIETIEEEGIVGRAAALGRQLVPSIDALLDSACPWLVREVRGVGLLIGIEFMQEGHAGSFVVEMLGRRVLLSHSLNANRVVRLTPPANLSDADLEWLLDAVGSAARRLATLFPEPSPS